MKKMKLMLCGIALLLLVPVIGYQAYDANTTLNAETTEIDDSPLGEKIVDIARGSYGVSKYALTERGQIYAWGKNDTGQLGNGKVGVNVDKPSKVLNAENATDGETYLSNVIKIFGAQGGYNGHTVAITRDGKVYGWGSNANLQLGLPEKKNYLIPVEIPMPEGITGKDIEAFYLGELGVTYMLTTDGVLYSCGSSKDGMLALGSGVQTTSGFTKIEYDNEGNQMPAIKDIATGNFYSYFLGEDGFVYATGTYESRIGQGGGIKLYAPAKVKTDERTYLSNIVELVLHTSSGIGCSLFKAQNGDIYDNYNKKTGAEGYFALFDNIVDPYNVLYDAKDIQMDSGAGSTFLGADGKLYSIPKIKGGGAGVGITLNVEKYKAGEIPEDYTNAKKIIGNYLDDLLLTKEGSVYVDGVKIGFGDILISGKKASDNTAYKSKEKYNDSISLLINTASIGNLRYREKDLIEGSTSETKTGSASLDISVSNEERIYKTFEYFLDGEEVLTKASFTIDLYKKKPVVDDIKSNGVYQQKKAITLGYNGFAENTISAKLKKQNVEATEYTSGTPIQEIGFYELTVKDQYGNTNSYSFEITDKPVAESITFTKNPNGELIYANSITKANNQIGTISLVYPAGTNASTIASATVKNEGDGVNFEIKNNNQLYIKTSDLTAKEYNVPIEGEDANGMPFSGEVKITIAKATQTMAWDEPSAKLADDGITLGDEVTLGVKDALGNVNVTYGLKTPNSCITMTENKGKVTCIPNPASVTFTATPSGNDNYTSDPIELTVSISKKSISLKTVIRDSDSTFKDRVSVKVGDTTPAVKVVDVDGK